MKIAICCGCLEPGRDGVGDYTRRLASQLSVMGHQVMLIALKDRFPAQDWHDGSYREVLSDGVIVLRLSGKYLSSERQTIAATELQSFAPDAISLQFVCYSFNDKGIAHDFVAFFEPLWKIAPIRHLMLHELWIIPKNIKDTIVATLQRFYVMQIVKRLKPKSVYVTNRNYKLRLIAAGAKNVEILPLFSNIPISSSLPSGWLMSLLIKKGVVTVNTEQSRLLIGGTFGAIYPKWDPTHFFDELRTASQESDRKVVIVSAGRKGTTGSTIWSCIENNYKEYFTFADIGELPAECISWFLQSINFGLPTVSLELMGKSSTTVAMLEHGLPVIFCQKEEIKSARTSFTVNAVETSHLIHMYQPGIAIATLNGLPRSTAKSHLSEVAAHFVRQLREAIEGDESGQQRERRTHLSAYGVSKTL